MQIKGLLSQSLALGEDITQLQKELPAINQNIITVNNNYQQITSYIEQQKTCLLYTSVTLTPKIVGTRSLV